MTIRVTRPPRSLRRSGQDPPTDEQAAVIESNARSCLVVAGAGSGKTETMAGRVVWLVANGLVRPDQVLGLTFTRKAAAELAARVRRRLGQLAAHGLVDAEVISAADPTISTYDAYAGRIVAENALRIGREPGQRLIPQTVAWQYARRVVDTYDGPMDRRAGLAHDRDQRRPRSRRGSRATSGDQRRAARLLRGACMPCSPRCRRRRPREPRRISTTTSRSWPEHSLRGASCCRSWRRTTRRSAAANVSTSPIRWRWPPTSPRCSPKSRRTERSTYRAVLLDEYQDTSHAQFVFLRALFGAFHRGLDASPLLTAVGDPSQAIYGWRGASQGTLVAFPQQFPDADQPASVLTLSTSFRNERSVLAVANAIAEPLRDGRVSTPELRARAAAVDRRGALRPVSDRRRRGAGRR